MDLKASQMGHQDSNNNFLICPLRKLVRCLFYNLYFLERREGRTDHINQTEPTLC